MENKLVGNELHNEIKCEEVEIKHENIDVDSVECKPLNFSASVETGVILPSPWAIHPLTFKRENDNHSRLKLPSWLKKNTPMTNDFNPIKDKATKDGPFKSKEKKEIKEKRLCVNKKSNEGKRSKCSECSRGFNKKSNLTFHILKVHKKLKPFECSKCDKTYFEKKSYLLHTDSAHESLYDCSECDKSFSLRSSLSHHILMDHIHPNSSNCNFLHKCGECKTYFRSKSKLYQHSLSIHNTIHYFCSECSRYFSCEGKLSRHVYLYHRKMDSSGP